MIKDVIKVLAAATMLLLLLLGAALVAGEPTPIKNAQEFYIKSFCRSFEKGFSMTAGRPLSEKEREAVRKEVAFYVLEDLSPSLESDGLLDEWAACQLDPENQQHTEKVLRADNKKELVAALKEHVAWTNKKYPRVVHHATQHKALYHRHMVRLETRLLKIFE